MNSGQSFERTVMLPAVVRRANVAAAFVTLALAVIVVCCAVLAQRAWHVPAPSARAAPSGDDTDALGITYASRLTNGASASAHTRLFDDPSDRAAQLQALREDDVYARDDNEHAVGFAENRLLFSVCNPGAPLDGVVQCSGRNGYILHLALRGDATAAQQSAALDHYGPRWAAIFARYHPRNRHCALVVLASDVTAEDEADNDDNGDGLIASKCFR